MTDPTMTDPAAASPGVRAALSAGEARRSDPGVVVPDSAPGADPILWDDDVSASDHEHEPAPALAPVRSPDLDDEEDVIEFPDDEDED